MAKRRFSVEIVRHVTIEVDDSVFATVDDEWRSHFYNLTDATDVVEHLAFNLTQGRRLSSLDGFALLPDDAAEIVHEEDWDLGAVEVTAKPRRMSRR